MKELEVPFRAMEVSPFVGADDSVPRLDSVDCVAAAETNGVLLEMYATGWPRSVGCVRPAVENSEETSLASNQNDRPLTLYGLKGRGRG